LLLKQSAAQASVDWQQGTRVTVWLQPDATSNEITAVGNQLNGMPIVKHCVYYSQAKDFAQAKKDLASR